MRIPDSPYPRLGLVPRHGRRPRVLVVERIPPFSVEMVYSTASWWQQLSSCSISVVNVWPVDTYGALPASIDLREFDAIVVFPRLGYDPITLQFLDRRLPVSFREYRGVKILMRQDENLMTERIESFLIDHGFDALMTCVPPDQVSRAYPRLAGEGIVTQSLLTGYVTPDMRMVERAPYERRPIDLSYRAYRGPVSNGELVHDKYRIGEVALREFAAFGFALDISLDPADRLIGQDWRNHLGASKAVLGTESGSNLFDFDGAVYRWAQRFEWEHEGSALTAQQRYEIARPHLEHLEGNVRYAQVSPRHLEAASLGAMQVLFPGRYSDLMQPGRHYIELQRDFSNITEVAEAIRDPSVFQQVTDRAFDEVVMNRELWIESAVSQLDGLLLELLSARDTQRLGTAGRTRRDRVPRPDAVAGRVLHVMSAGETIRTLPYYFDDEIARRRLGCVRVVLGAEDVARSRTDVFPWLALPFGAWTPSQSTPPVAEAPIRSAVARLAATARSSVPEITQLLGGYDDRFGSIPQFRSDCIRALQAIDSMTEWLGDGAHPGAVIVSDPIALGAALHVSDTLGIEIAIDFEGLSRVLGRMPGWQARYWEQLVVKMLVGSRRHVLLAASPEAVSRARGLLGEAPILFQADRPVDAALWRDVPPLDEVMRPGASEPPLPPTGDDVADSSGGARELTRSIVEEEILPLIEETFGIESVRYWSLLRESVLQLREQGDAAAAVDLLLTALDRFIGAGAHLQLDPVLSTVLERRRIHVLNLLMASDVPLETEASLHIFERVMEGSIPITTENRRAAWRLALNLCSSGAASQHSRLYRLLIDSQEPSDPASVAADVHGLLNLLAHHWVRRDHFPAIPIAEALAEIHDRAETDGGVRLDDNVIARIAAVRKAGQEAGNLLEDQNDPSLTAQLAERPSAPAPDPTDVVASQPHVSLRHRWRRLARRVQTVGRDGRLRSR